MRDNWTCGRGTEVEQQKRHRKIKGMSLGGSRTAAQDDDQLDAKNYRADAVCPSHGMGGAARIRGRWGMNCCGEEPVQSSGPAC